MHHVFRDHVGTYAKPIHTAAYLDETDTAVLKQLASVLIDTITSMIESRGLVGTVHDVAAQTITYTFDIDEPGARLSPNLIDPKKLTISF